MLPSSAWPRSASSPGIFLAVALALGAFVWRAWRPYSAILGRVDGVKGYHDVTRYPEARRVDGLVLFRWDAPLFFANAELFREQVEAAIAAAPTPTRWVVVAAEPVTDIDMTAADMLAELIASLDAAGRQPAVRRAQGPGQGPPASATACSSRSARTRSSRPSASAVDAYVAETGDRLGGLGGARRGGRSAGAARGHRARAQDPAGSRDRARAGVSPGSAPRRG